MIITLKKHVFIFEHIQGKFCSCIYDWPLCVSEDYLQGDSPIYFMEAGQRCDSNNIIDWLRSKNPR